MTFDETNRQRSLKGIRPLTLSEYNRIKDDQDREDQQNRASYSSDNDDSLSSTLLGFAAGELISSVFDSSDSSDSSSSFGGDGGSFGGGGSDASWS